MTETLGLQPIALDGRLRIVRPTLPRFVDDLSIRGLAVGGSRVDLEFHRSGGRVEVSVGHVTGELDVLIADGPDTDSREARS
jgi:hypothetical protein